MEERKVTELEKLVNEKKGGSRGSASSNGYLSALVEQKKNEQKMATPYADAVKSGAGAQNLYATVAKKMQGQTTMQTPYADAAAQVKQSGTNNNFLHGIAGIFEKAAAGAKEGLRTSMNEMGYRAQAAAPLNAADDAYYKAMWEQTTGRKTGVEVPTDTRTQEQKDLDEYMGVADLKNDSARAMQRAAEKGYERLDKEGVKTTFQRDNTYQERVDQRYADLGPKWQQAMSIAGSVGNQALPMIGRLVGTALLGDKGGEAFQSLLFFNQASGAAIEEALADGAKWDEALTYGTVIGSIEAATEAAGDMANKVTIKAAGKYLPKEQFTKALIGTLTSNKSLRTVLSLLGQMHGEGLEEVASDLVSPFAKSIYNGKTLGENWVDDVTIQGLWESYLGGAISGGILAGLGGALQGQFRAQNQNYANETVNAKLEEARASMKENGLFNSETREKILDAGTELDTLETQQQTAAQEAREHMKMIREMQRALRGDVGAQTRLSNVQEGTYTSEMQNAPVGAQRAQNEGINTTPAAAMNIQEGMNNGQSAYQGRENGAYDLRAGGQAATESGTQAFAGSRSEIPGGVGQSTQADLRQVTPAQLGIKNGGTEAVTVVDAQQLGGEAKSAYDTVTRQGMEPIAIRGAIQVGSGYANAYTESGKVYFRVDAVDSNGNIISPEALVHHELFHNYISEEGLRVSAEVIRESMTAEEYDSMYEAYRDAYASIYDFETMSVEEIERILREEIAADAYAGLNFFSEDGQVQEAVRTETERNAPAQRAEAQQETTGPPGRTMVEVARERGNIQRNSIEYADNAARNAAQKALHDRMVSEGKMLDLTENREAASQYFPDLRSMPKAERKVILREKIKLLKDDLRTYLRQIKGASFEFEINGETIEAKLYNTGIQEVLENLTQEKSGMLFASEEIFKNAEYLYSTTDKRGNPEVSGWDYFYVPVKLGDDTAGVRIAVRNMIQPNEAQIYNWGIKKEDAPLGGGGPLPFGSASTGASSDASSNERSSGPVAGTQSANIDSNAAAPSETNIRSAAGNSQEKSSGRASVEVENRDSNNGNASSDNENRDSNNKKGRKKLSEAEKYQNTTIKKSETRTVRNAAEYEKQISRMEKRLETGGQATLNEGGGNFYRANIREENGEYYAYVSDGKNVVAKHQSKSKMEAIRWAGDRVRAEIASRILYNPDTELRGSYQSDLKSAENREYPVFKAQSGTEVQTVPFWTWVQDKAGHYGLVVGNDVNGAVRAWFPFGGDGNGTVISATNTTLYAVEGDYESRAWNNDIVADVLNDAEESAAARNAREERLRESREADQQRLDRMTKRDDTLHQINRENGRPAPNKGSGEVYRELMSKGKSEVLTPISMDNPRTLSYKITLDTNVLGVATATVMHNGHQIYKETGPIKEYVARDVAEFVDVQANKNFSEENFERARQLEAEKTGDEDARIAELFGDSEEAAKQELTDKTVKKLTEKGRAEEAEEYAARATIAGTTEKVIPEVLKAERNFREDIEKITSGAMRMFVNAGDTVRRIAEATKSKSLEGYYFNAGAYSQRAGNWIAKGGARTDIDGHKIGTSLADTLAPMRKDAKKYRDFQLYLLHMHNVDRMKYDNSAELQRIKDELIRTKERYPQLKELSAQELARVASDAADDPITRAEAHEMYIEAHQGKDPPIGTVNMAAAYIQELQKQRAVVENQGLKPVFGYDVTADDSKTAAMLLAAENPEFKEWAKEVYKYSDDLIRYRVEAGLITREFADALKKRYPHYIPTFREEGTNSKRARSARRNGGIVVSNAIGRAVGSDGVLLPLHTALSRKTVSTMRNAGLNQFGLALVREHDGNKKATEKYIWNVAESEYTSTEAAIENDEDYKPVFQNIFSVKENGKAYDITMDEGLTAAMKAFEPDKFANYGAAKFMKGLNDLFKALCTGYNPFFMIRNGVRDWQDAGFYSTDWKTWEKMYWSAWNQIRTNGEIWQQYVALGGSYSSMLDYTTGMVKEPKNLIGKAAARYEHLGQAIEAAPRLAEFMTILANKGGSKTVDGVKTGQFTQSDLMEAMLGAADITTNFARGGSVTKALNRYLVPFLNPSIQGFDKFIRNATETRSVKAAGSLILKAALMGIAPALINALAYRDDDEWDDIPADTKANYYLINFGDGIWLKIPKGRAIAVLSTAAVYGQEKLKGEDVKFSDVFEVIKSNIAPTDIFNQNIATAWTQAKLTNPDNPGTTWYGGNIESDRLQNYRPGDRYDENTDALSKAIGQKFNISPKKLNYLLDQYSGVIGDLLLPLITPATKSSHWLLAAPQAAFTIDTTSNNKTTGEYYDLLDDLKYDANDGDAGAGITRKYVSHAGDEVNDYYAQIREIQNDKELTKAEKNRLVRALKSQLIERQKEIIEQAEPYREAVDKYLKAHPELSTDNDAAIAEYAEQYEITEDQAESRMDAIVYREANREVFGAEYALRTYNADVYDKARAAYAKGVSYDTYYDYYFATKEMHADKDENGKSISGSKKAKVVEYINSLDIPAEQKDALYIAAGYTEKSARYQKWNGGSGGSGGSGKRTTLKAPAPKAGKIIIPEASAKTGSTAKSGTTKTTKASGNVIADFTQKSSGTDIQKAVTQAKRKAIKAGNRTVYVEEGSPIDYFLKYGKLPSVK